MLRAVLPLGALIVLPWISLPSPRPVAVAPLDPARPLVTLAPGGALAWIEAPGLSEVLEGGLAHPLVARILDAGAREAFERERGLPPVAAVAAADAILGFPLLDTAAALCEGGVGLALYAGEPKPRALLLMRASDADLVEETLARSLELAATAAGYPGAFREPSRRSHGAEVWFVGDDLTIARRDALLWLSADRALVDSALALSTNAEAAGLSTAPGFLAREASGAPLLRAWMDLEAIRTAPSGAGLAELTKLAARPDVHLLLGPGLATIGRAGTATAALRFDGAALALDFEAAGVDAGAAAVLLPSDAGTAPSVPANARDVARAVLHRDFASVLEHRVDVFPAETLPGFAEALGTMALFFGGADVEDDVLPGLDPWLGVVARHVTFDDGARPDLPLPAVAVLARVADVERLGPRLSSAFQTAIGLTNVDRAQKGRDSMLLSIEAVDSVPVTHASFLAPAEGEGVDLRYNLVPACGVVGDVLVVGTHKGLVHELVSELGRGAPAPEPRLVETLHVEAPAVRELLTESREALVVRAVLEEGKDRAEAESDVDGMLYVLELLAAADVSLRYGSRDSLGLRLELTLAETGE